MAVNELPDVIRHTSLEEIELAIKRAWERIGDELERALLIQDLQACQPGQKWHFNPSQPRDSHGRWTGGGAVPPHIAPGTPAMAASLVPLPGPSAAVSGYLAAGPGGAAQRVLRQHSLAHYMVRYARSLQNGTHKPQLPAWVLWAYGGGVAMPTPVGDFALLVLGEPPPHPGIPDSAPWSSAADRASCMARILAVMNAPGNATNAELTAAVQSVLFPP